MTQTGVLCRVSTRLLSLSEPSFWVRRPIRREIIMGTITEAIMVVIMEVTGVTGATGNRI
jgi:hypothetical protein